MEKHNHHFLKYLEDQPVSELQIIANHVIHLIVTHFNKVNSRLQNVSSILAEPDCDYDAKINDKYADIQSNNAKSMSQMCRKRKQEEGMDGNKRQKSANVMKCENPGKDPIESNAQVIMDMNGENKPNRLPMNNHETALPRRLSSVATDQQLSPNNIAAGAKDVNDANDINENNIKTEDNTNQNSSSSGLEWESDEDEDLGFRDQTSCSTLNGDDDTASLSSQPKYLCSIEELTFAAAKSRYANNKILQTLTTTVNDTCGIVEQL